MKKMKTKKMKKIEKVKVKKAVFVKPAQKVNPNALHSEYMALWQCFNPSGSLKAVKKIVKSKLKEINRPFKCDDLGNISIGDFDASKPCIVAHLDSVHTKKSIVFTKHGHKLSSDNGIGGDDKCGIIAVFESLKKCDVNAVFFIDEEIGCIGSGRCDKAIFKNVMYFIEVDRRGCTDVIDNLAYPSSVSDDFAGAMLPLITAHDFKFENGSYTDLSEILPEVKIAGINLCAGYYNAHTSSEYVMLDELADSITYCIDLFNTVRKQFKIEVNEIDYYGYGSASYPRISMDARSIHDVCREAEETYFTKEITDLIMEAYEIGMDEGIGLI